MPSVGLGVQEIRIHTGAEHRVLYVARFAEAIYVLHAFEKRTRQTPKDALDLARQRLRSLINTGGRNGRDRCSVKKAKLTGSRGDVFRDLGFSPDEAAYLKVRSELMVKLQKAITARGLKQADAAKLLGVTQPRVSDLMRGRIDLFSIDTLIDMLAWLGIRTKLVLLPSHRRAGVA
jgi:predicted XRE-type DNA-binding protein